MLLLLRFWKASSCRRRLRRLPPSPGRCRCCRCDGGGHPGDATRVGAARGREAPRPSDAARTVAAASAVGIHGGGRRDPVPQTSSSGSFVFVVAPTVSSRCFLDDCLDLGLRPSPVDETRHPLQAQRAGVLPALQQPMAYARDAEGRVAAGQQGAAEGEALRRGEADGTTAVIVEIVEIGERIIVLSPPLLGGSCSRLEHLESDVVIIIFHFPLSDERNKGRVPRSASPSS